MKWNMIKDWDKFRKNAHKKATNAYNIGHTCLLGKLIMENLDDITKIASVETFAAFIALDLFFQSTSILGREGKSSKGVLSAMGNAIIGKAILLGGFLYNGNTASATGMTPDMGLSAWTVKNAYEETKKHGAKGVLAYFRDNIKDTKLEKVLTTARDRVAEFHGNIKDSCLGKGVKTFKEKVSNTWAVQEIKKVPDRIKSFRENIKDTSLGQTLEEYPYLAPMSVSILLKAIAISGFINDIVHGRANNAHYWLIPMYTSWSFGAGFMASSKQDAQKPKGLKS